MRPFQNRQQYIRLGVALIILTGICAVLWMTLYQRPPPSVPRHIVVQKLHPLRQRSYTMQERARYMKRHLAADALREMQVMASDDSIPVWRRMVTIAKIYFRGIYPYYSPNRDVAQALCRTVILHCPHTTYKTEARVLMFSDCMVESTIDVARDSAPLPLEPAARLTRLAMESRQQGSNRTTDRTPVRPPVRVVGEEDRAVDGEDIIGDSQNSHDHGVVSHVAKVLQTLPHAETGTIRDDIEAYIATSCGDHITDDEKAQALQCLESIRDDVDHPKVGVSEEQALARVWNAAQYKDLVVQQLASGIERGLPVCHTGKLSRIAASLDDGQREDTKILPMWAVKDDLYRLASKVRDTVLDEASPDQTQAYNESTTGSALQTKMVDAFRRECDEYRVSTGLSPIVLRAYVDDICEHGF